MSTSQPGWRTVDTVKFFTWLVSLAYCACLWMFGLAALIFGGWTALEVFAAAACVTVLSVLIAAAANAVAEAIFS